MVKLRLFRMGKKKQAFFRIVAAESRNPRNGRYIELLGHYNPHTDPPTVELKKEGVERWLEKGAQPTPAVEKLLVMAGIRERPVYPEKKPPAPPEEKTTAHEEAQPETPQETEKPKA